MLAPALMVRSVLPASPWALPGEEMAGLAA